MKKGLILLFLLLLPVTAHAANACADANRTKITTPIAIGSATTIQLVSLTTTAAIHGCGFSFSLSGTTPGLQFVYGSGTNCATGQTALSGAFGASANFGAGSSDVFVVPPGNALCAITTGTTPSAQGIFTYVRE